MQNLGSLTALKTATCFLFDLDGTLIDSSPCHERSYLIALGEEHPELAKTFDYVLYKGKSTKETFVELGIEEIEAVTKLTQKKQSIYREMIENGDVLAFPAALEFLRDLKETERRICLVTGASRRSAESSLTKLGLRQYFEGLVTGDEIEKTKPAPDLYLKCLDEYKINAVDAIVIEDSLLGVQAAQAAGLNVIAVNDPEMSRFPEYVGTLQDLHQAWKQNKYD